jgi:hypothetical protein
VKLSELVARLETIRLRHGDLDVTYLDTYDGGAFAGGVAISTVEVSEFNGGAMRKNAPPEVLLS